MFRKLSLMRAKRFNDKLSWIAAEYRGQVNLPDVDVQEESGPPLITVEVIEKRGSRKIVNRIKRAAILSGFRPKITSTEDDSPAREKITMFIDVYGYQRGYYEDY